MSLTSDPKNPDLNTPKGPGQQNKTYLVLSDAERAKGFVRPVRRSYVHVGPRGPQHQLRDLTAEEVERYGKGENPYVKFEPYAASDGVLGRYWSQAQLDAVDKGCGALTTMDPTIAETYAREPDFYGSTWCCGCRKHLKVGRAGEFVWDDTDELVGT